MSRRFGRVIFYKGNEQPEYISNENQPFPFVIGPEGVNKFASFLVAADNHNQLLFDLGFEEEWLREKVSSGYRFYLMTFTDDVPGLDPVRADWDGIMQVVEREAPECYLAMSPASIAEMRATPYAAYNPHVDLLLPDEYAKFSSFSSFAQYAQMEVINARACRAFLRHTMKCTSLFAGDGYTYNANGERGFDEYIIRRRSVAELTSEPLVQLTIEL